MHLSKVLKRGDFDLAGDVIQCLESLWTICLSASDPGRCLENEFFLSRSEPKSNYIFVFDFCNRNSESS